MAIFNNKQLIARIEINPRKLGGKPLIRATRVPVEQILNLLTAGNTIDDILDDFPQLDKKDIMAAMYYATKLIEDLQVYPKEFIRQIKLQPA